MNSNILLLLGTSLLGSGLYFGLAKSGSSQLILILLGGSIAAFSTVVVVLLMSHTLKNLDPKKSETESTPKAAPGIASELDAKAGLNEDIKANGNTETKLAASTESVLKAGIEPDSAPKPLPIVDALEEPVYMPSIGNTSEIPNTVNCSSKSGITLLMSTPLGDLLLSALLKDPENAGRFVTQAILQAQAPSSIRPE